MTKQLILLTLLLLVLYTSAAQTLTDHIHVDQFGYLENTDKVAVISDPIIGYNSSDSYIPASQMKVVDTLTNAVVFTGNVVSWNNESTHNQSGDRGWWFDFSSLTIPGEYYILDEVNNTKSNVFEIKESVYRDVAKAALKMFYYNRCNDDKIMPYVGADYVDGMNFQNALQDANCRSIFDPNNTSLERDLSGGWFDAGDYNKYTTFATDVVHNLLYAYQESSQIFGDDWNIPESGNSIPDILDEVTWELVWLEKMMNSDGSAIVKMGSQNYSENVSSPPSANTDQRFYGATCSSASLAIASMFSHAALVYETIPGLEDYADTLKNKAITCFDYVLPQLNSNALDEACDNGEIVAGDADVNSENQYQMALEAAVYLYELTDSTVYDTYIKNHINDAKFVSENWLGQGTNSILESLLHYSTLANADAATVTEIDNSIRPHVEGDWNDFFGMNEVDLYRAYVPDWAYDWGSTRAKAEFGILNRILKNYDFYPTDSASYAAKEIETVHYFHGINPLNIVYLSNMYALGAEKSVNQLYHTWFADGTDYDDAQNSLYGPAPGFVTGGPNKAYPYTGLTPPYGQPEQKSYLDFNDGTIPEEPWRISEPAIYYQAAYLRLVAAFANKPCSEVKDIYVDISNNSAMKNGLEWSSALTSVTEAMVHECIDKVDTIHIAEGVYIPNTMDRDFSYDLPDEIVLKGGYQAGGLIYLPRSYTSKLSANIGDDASDQDDLYHGFYFPFTERNLTLMGLSIMKGNANGQGVHSEGAGILNQGNMKLMDVIIEE